MAEQNPALTRFDVDVCRTGFGFATIRVMAASAQEADELALDRAGEYEYSEKDAEYTLVHPSAPEPSQGDAMELILEMKVDESNPFMGSAVKGVVLKLTPAALAEWKERAEFAERHQLSEARKFAGALEVLTRAGRGNEGPHIDRAEICWTKSCVWIVGADGDNGAELTSPVFDLSELFKLAEAGCERLVVGGDVLSFVECLGEQDARDYTPSATTVLMNTETASAISLSEFQRYFGTDDVERQPRES